MIDRGGTDKERKHEWVVILAGGDGTRLKSLSRRITGDERPKQFCPVISDISLVKETQKRVALELPKERTLFLVNRLHEPYYSDILSDIAASNLIEQPRNIGTAPAILYSVLKIAAADPQAFVAFFRPIIMSLTTRSLWLISGGRLKPPTLDQIW
jgi:mannose-1-phosphate guanylyltransferase